MHTETHRPIDFSQVISGFSVVLVGILCGLWRQGFISVTELVGLWPLALISIGLGQAVDRERPKNHSGGWALTLVGSLLLFGNQLAPNGNTLEIWLGLFPVRVSWPLLLVAIGGYVAWRELATVRSLPEEER